MNNKFSYVGHDGRRGTIASPTEALNLETPLSTVEFEDGEILQVPTNKLRKNADGSYSPFENYFLTAVEERLKIEKRTVATGILKIQKIIHEREEVVDEPLIVNSFDIRRIPMNVAVESLLPSRQEGDTTIYSVVEEVAIVTKGFVLREEIHVTPQSTVIHRPQTVHLERDEILVERSEAVKSCVGDK